jgi:hypothetical protein
VIIFVITAVDVIKDIKAFTRSAKWFIANQKEWCPLSAAILCK